jgi:hypothetical protein
MPPKMWTELDAGQEPYYAVNTRQGWKYSHLGKILKPAKLGLKLSGRKE